MHLYKLRSSFLCFLMKKACFTALHNYSAVRQKQTIDEFVMTSASVGAPLISAPYEAFLRVKAWNLN